MSDPQKQVVSLEILEDLTSQSRLDEGFIRVRRVRCQNRRADGSTSAPYTIDLVGRPVPDAVAVLVYRHTAKGLEVLTRDAIRPAAFFRAANASPQLHIPEVVAGVLEEGEAGEASVRARAAAEVREEAGIEVGAAEIRLMGGPVFMSPGVLNEKVYLTRVDVTGKAMSPPLGDGSPLEEDARLQWWKVSDLLVACRNNGAPDAKTELALVRFLSGVGAPGRGPQA